MDDVKKALELDFSWENELKSTHIKYAAMLNTCKDDLGLSQSFLDSARMCSSYMQFLATADFKKKKLHKSNRCHHRFCPVCQKLESKKLAMTVLTAFSYVTQALGKRVLFVTLTVPNVKGDELKDTIKRMGKAYGKMFDSRSMRNKGSILGSYRILEITYNSKSDTFHPHLHCAWVVDTDYFNNTDKYITHEELLEKWRFNYGDESITQVDIRPMGTDKKDILELSKYVAKSNDYLINNRVFETYFNALKGVNRYTASGVLKDVFKMIKNGSLKLIGKEDSSMDYIYKLFLRWASESNSYEITNVTPYQPKPYVMEPISQEWDLGDAGRLVKFNREFDMTVEENPEPKHVTKTMKDRDLTPNDINEYILAQKYVNECFAIGLDRIPLDKHATPDDFLTYHGQKIISPRFYLQGVRMFSNRYEAKEQMEQLRDKQLKSVSGSEWFSIKKPATNEKAPFVKVLLKYDENNNGVSEPVLYFHVLDGSVINVNQLEYDGCILGNWKLEKANKLVKQTGDIVIHGNTVLVANKLKKTEV